jgi:hypothetical protein
MPITPEQYHEIREIVRLSHESVVEALCGNEALPEHVKRALTAAGIPRLAAPGLAPEIFMYGTVLAAQPDPGPRGVPGADVSYEDFLQRLSRRPAPLSYVEANAVEFARQRAGRYCRGLANTVQEGVEDVIIEATAEHRAVAEAAVKEAVAEARLWRETTDRIRTRIGRATGDWTRDLGRIAATESNNALQDGVGAAIEDAHGKGALVAKRPNPDACEACKSFYLDELGNPKIYRLSELQGKTNARDPARPGKGRRRKDYVATLESLHPWCACSTHWIPSGYGYDEGGHLVPFSLLSGEYLLVAQRAHGISPRVVK